MKGHLTIDLAAESANLVKLEIAKKQFQPKSRRPPNRLSKFGQYEWQSNIPLADWLKRGRVLAYVWLCWLFRW
jgi:hypothetical protein